MYFTTRPDHPRAAANSSPRPLVGGPCRPGPWATGARPHSDRNATVSRKVPPTCITKHFTLPPPLLGKRLRQSSLLMLKLNPAASSVLCPSRRGGSQAPSRPCRAAMNGPSPPVRPSRFDQSFPSSSSPAAELWRRSGIPGRRDAFGKEKGGRWVKFGRDSWVSFELDLMSKPCAKRGISARRAA